MNGVRFTYPDTGELAWFCVCLKDDCNAVAIGPYRERSDAELEADDECDCAHLVTDQIGPGMRLVYQIGNQVRPDWHALTDEIVAFERAQSRPMIGAVR